MNKSNLRATSRMLARALPLGLVFGLIALGKGEGGAAIGAFAGALAAGLYVSGYLSSHLGAVAQVGNFKPRAARAAFGRLFLTALGGAGAYTSGKAVLVAYLISFGAAFAVLVALEIPGIRSTLRSGGVISPGQIESTGRGRRTAKAETV